MLDNYLQQTTFSDVVFFLGALRVNISVLDTYPNSKQSLGHNRLTIETPFEWCFAGGPMVARFYILTG